MLSSNPLSSSHPTLRDDDETHRRIGLGMTMILATHQMGFARNIADQVVFLDRGEIVEQNDPATFFDHPPQDRTRQFINHILSAT